MASTKAPFDMRDANALVDTDPAFGRINRLHSTLRKEDDRGVVLLASAYLDGLLGRLLEAFLVSGKSARTLVNGFNAPLGSFASRIGAAHAMGLISDCQHDDLQHLRKIRNEMAHTWNEISLDTPAIAGRVMAMSDTRIPDEPGKKSSSLSDKMRECVSCLMIELEVMIDQLAKGKRGRRLSSIALHLSLTPPND